MSLTWMEASMRSSGFCIHSSQRFSREAVLEVAAELASEAAEAGAAKLEIAPKGPASNQQDSLLKKAPFWILG